MGSVYEAIDRELDVRLALKTLRAESAAPSALERFKREIHVARQVTHPNVCRLYDLGRHRSAEGQDLVFLTMQFLDGETLRERLNRAGRLSPEESLPLVRDMAAALDAAHQAGIVHRDFKSGNVMLVPAREGLRAVVTDFGLAREMVDSGRETLTVTAGFVGTPAYSSPEQIQGFEVGPASDIYAFGVVLYEMVTGRLPFDDAPTPWIAVVRRLNELPTAPQALVPELPDGWNAAILRCLEREPEARFAAAWDVAEALELPFSEMLTVPMRAPATPVVAAAGSGSRPASGSRPSDPRKTPRPRGGTTAVNIPVGFDTATLPVVTAPPAKRLERREWALIAGGALLLLCGLLFAWLRPDLPAGGPGTDSREGLESGESASRRSIALLGFKNLKGSDEADWISTAVTEMLAMDVASGDALRVIPSEQVARMKTEMRLGEDEGYSAERLARVRENLGSDLVVLGSYLLENGALRLDVRVQNASDGEVISRVSEKGKASDLIALVERVGDRLRRELGLSGLSEIEVQAMRAAFPESSSTARTYAEGLGHLHRFELVEATRLLEQAAREAPGNAMVQMALSDAYQLAGYEAKADTAARAAYEASRDLAPRYRLWIEAIHHEASRDWERAIQTFQELNRLYPDDLEVGLRLAKLQLGHANRFDDALATCEKLEKLPLPAGNDPRIDLLKAFAYLRKGLPERALAVAEVAAAEGHARGAVITEASAFAYIGSAQLALARHELALTAIDRARQLFLSVGYREGASQTLTSSSQVLRARGDWSGARQRLEEAISLQRQIGVTAKLRTSLGWLGGLYESRGEIAKAKATFEECLELSAGFEDQVALNRFRLAESLLLGGELEAAREHLDAAWAYAERTNDQKNLSEMRSTRGLLELLEGHLVDAQNELEKVVEAYRDTSQLTELVNASLLLAEIELTRGDLPRAKALLEQAASARRAEKQETSYMVWRLRSAAVALEEDRLDEAEKLLTEQLEVPPSQQLPHHELEALIQLARLELRRGGEAHRAAALAYAERATERLETVENVWRRLLGQIAVQRTRGLVDPGRSGEAALSRLRALRAEAERRPYPLAVFEAELAMGEIEKSGLDPASGRARLSSLASRAAAAGFLSLSRRAEAAKS